MQKTINIIRLIVGVLFIFSGLIKANDPSGLAYKMDEYFAVWGWHWASAYSFGLSIAMNVFEIVAGVALIIGWNAKLITRLLLLLIVFFTFLTGYAVFSGKIKTCGCFGDCIPLQAYQSFIKDVILLVLIVFLYYHRDKIKPLLSLRANLFLLLFSLGFVFWGQLHVLKNLPYVDCLPYAKGNNLVEKMQAPPGSVPDSIAVFYTYRVNGKSVEFEAADFPADFDEAKYEYVSRENRVIVKGNAEPPIKDMAFFTPAGADTTLQLLQTTGPYLLFFARDYDSNDQIWKDDFLKIFFKSKEENIPLFLVTNKPNEAQRYLNETNHFNVPVLTCDGTVMKSMLRNQNGIIAMKGAEVKEKWAEANINEVVKFINEKGFDQ